MEFFKGVRGYDHTSRAKTGVLLVNLGTPDAPTTKELRPYLKKFLSDPRVIELPKLKWQLILNLFILPFRSKTSAKLYQQIWTPEGSPLLLYTMKQRDALRSKLDKLHPNEFAVEAGMRIGKPSLESAMHKLREANVQRLLVIPMFPQYSSTTNGSVFDGLADELKTWRWIPELRMLSGYHDQPEYITSLANSVTEFWNEKGRPEKLLISFHGIPQRYFDNGDPYYCFCQKTARLLTEKLGLKREEEFLVSFQSLFGKEEWLRPYTSETLEAWAEAGVKDVDVICPGFSADCLETIEEIEEQNCEIFLKAGGRRFRYIPALNDRPDHIDMLVALVEQNAQGWMGKSAPSVGPRAAKVL